MNGTRTRPLQGVVGCQEKEYGVDLKYGYEASLRGQVWTCVLQYLPRYCTCMKYGLQLPTEYQLCLFCARMERNLGYNP